MLNKESQEKGRPNLWKRRKRKAFTPRKRGNRMFPQFLQRKTPGRKKKNRVPRLYAKRPSALISGGECEHLCVREERFRKRAGRLARFDCTRRGHVYRKAHVRKRKNRSVSIRRSLCIGKKEGRHSKNNSGGEKRCCFSLPKKKKKGGGGGRIGWCPKKKSLVGWEELVTCNVDGKKREPSKRKESSTTEKGRERSSLLSKKKKRNRQRRKRRKGRHDSLQGAGKTSPPS